MSAAMTERKPERATALLEPGMVLRDTYEVERFLGEGAFAEVYRVKHRFLGRQALKIFKRAGMGIQDIHKMLSEAILLSRIGHPNIVRVYDANVLDSPRGPLGYFTMENVSGGSLRKFWQSYANSLVPMEISLDLIKQVCRGMSVAHSAQPPIIHRDIKPENILVGYEADGLRARVSDFGLAKAVNPLTLLATTAGTLAFKPPEAFTDTKGDSCASDVWGIAATLYMLLTDRLPVDSSRGGSVQASGRASPGGEPIAPPSQTNPYADEALDEIVLKGLSIRSADRYQTAEELLQALESWQPRRASRQVRAKSVSSEPSKLALGAPSAQDADGGQTLVDRAQMLSRSGRLPEAADVMEEAFNKSPSLREKYAEKVQLWRRGISM
jgi:serine/threonine-protein kinase